MRNRRPSPRTKGGNVLKIRFRRSWRNHRRLAIGFGLLLLAAWAIFPLKYRIEQRKEAADYQRKIEALKKENESLKREISRLKGDDYIEKLARKELGLAKPGEEVYLVYGDEVEPGKSAATTETPSSKKPSGSKQSLWERLLKLFGL